MQVIQDDLWLCVDCLFAAVNGDFPELEADADLVTAGLDKLGPHLVPDFDSEAEEDNGIHEFSNCGCDCCGSSLAGTMHRFAVLGDDTDKAEAS